MSGHPIRNAVSDLRHAIAETLEEMDPENKEVYAVQRSDLSRKNFLRWTKHIRKLLTMQSRKHWCLRIVFHSVIW